MRLFDRNLLAFPGGIAPGFDPSHIAAGSPFTRGISVVAIGDNFINVLNGQAGTITGTGGSGAVIAGLGKCVNFPSGQSYGINFPGFTTTASGFLTYAFIGFSNTLANGSGVPQIIMMATGTKQELLWDNISAPLEVISGGGGFFAGASVVQPVGVPYFCVVSIKGGVVSTGMNAVITDLKTGKIVSSISTSNNLDVLTNVSLFIGNNIGGNFSFNGYIAAAMYNNSFLSLSQLMEWAVDPWSYWYPPSLDQQQDEDVVGVAAAAGVPFNQEDWPLPVQPSRLDQSWTWQQTRMLGQDRLPNRQQDWPLPTPPPRLDQTWTRRQTGMFGQDRFPFRQQDWPLPVPPPPGASWTWRQTGMLGKDQLPFRQQDWPNPAPLPPPGATWTWRQTGMFGQDSLPFRQQDWSLPVLPPRLDETWIQGFSNLLSAIIVLYPKNQYDWPLPVQPPRLDQTWVWSQTDMIGQDRLPFRQQDWPLPTQPSRLDATWAQGSTLLLSQVVILYPKNQYDWPLPTPPPRLDQSWTWRQTGMFGQDRLPFRQQDWPLPTPPARLDQTFAWRQTGMFGQDQMPVGGRTFFALPPHPIKWIDLTWNFGPYVPTPPPPLITVVYSKQFFSQIGSIMGIPGDPPS